MEIEAITVPTKWASMWETRKIAPAAKSMDPTIVKSRRVAISDPDCDGVLYIEEIELSSRPDIELAKPTREIIWPRHG